MNKKDLVEFVASKNIVQTKADAERIVDGIFDEIKTKVSSGTKVSIAGFGIFDKMPVRAKKVRNPRTGESINMPAGSKVKFKVAKSFKEQIKS